LNGAIFEKVRQLAADIFVVPVQKIGADSSPDTISTWDSMQHLNLILALEEKFGFQLSPEEMEQMRSVGQISAMLESKLHSTPN
jgi:acyl carrier protein